jgi:F-type H+-transporting ATPase subunit gamma
MANLKEVRNRISSVKTTQQITKAMKLVSASKLKRAQDRITQMRPYALKLNSILSNLMTSLEGEEISLELNKVREPKNVLVVLLTSDKGLCGGFNSNLIKTARTLINTKYSAQAAAGHVTILPIGKKGYDFFKKLPNLKFDTTFIGLYNHLSFATSQEVSENLTADFLAGKYDVIEVVYAKFVNAATQNFSVDRFLPVAEAKAEITTVTGKKAKKNDYIFEPNKQQLLEELAPKILNTSFFRALLDTNASEFGARMVAMEAATNNAQELIKNLSIQYNRERQAAITKEILEIVGGAAALENG